MNQNDICTIIECINEIFSYNTTGMKFFQHIFVFCVDASTARMGVKDEHSLPLSWDRIFDENSRRIKNENDIDRVKKAAHPLRENFQ